MSLLIKALHQAEQKHAASNGGTPAEGLSLEPLAEAPGRNTASANATAQAGNYFNAAARTPRASLLGTLLDPRNWSLVPATLLLATGVAIAYGYYVYLMTRPPAVLSATPPTNRHMTPAAPLPDAAIAPAATVATPHPDETANGAPRRENATDKAAPGQPLFPAKSPLAPAKTSPPRNAAEGIRVAPAAATPPLANPLATQAYRALQEGRLDEAQGMYRRLHDQEPQNTDALLGLAAIAVQKNRVEQASKLYGQVLDLDPKNPAAQAGLIGLLGNADPVAAESRLKQLLADQPSAALYASLGNLYADQGKWAAAEQAYFDAQRLEPDNANHAFNLAVSLEHLNQPAVALNYYRRAQQFAGRGLVQFDPAQLAARIAELSARKQDPIAPR